MFGWSTSGTIIVAVLMVLCGLSLDTCVVLWLEKRRQKEVKSKRRERMVAWWPYVSKEFYEPLVYEAAKEVSETGNTLGDNVKLWSQFFNFLKDLGFLEVEEVSLSIRFIHGAKADKWMIEINWYNTSVFPYIETKQWFILYFDENKDQTAHLYSRCRRDALAEFPVHQLVKAKEIQVHNPHGDLTDSLTVEQTDTEVIVVQRSNIAKREIARYEKPKEEAVAPASEV